MKYLAPAAFIAVCLASTTAFAAPSSCDALAGNAVANCGFETGSFADWSLTGSTFELAQTNNYGIDSYDPSSGSYDAFFANQGSTLGTASPSSDITLSQNLSLTTGGAYQVSFSLAQDTPVSTGYTNFFSATFDSGVLLSETAAPATGTGNVTYLNYTYDVIALGTDTLAFSFQNDAGDWFLDDVSVTSLGGTAPVPEPATIALLAAALVGLTWAARRRSVHGSNSGDERAAAI